MSKSVEGVVLAEAIRLASKDSAKRQLVVGLYALSLKGLETGKIIRTSYFYVRHLDDLLDGEMEIEGEPLAYARERRKQIETGKLTGGSAIDDLAKYALPRLERRAKPGDDPRAEFLTVIDAMMFDYSRRQGRQVIATDKLLAHYKKSVDPGINIFLIATGSSLRTNAISDYGKSLARLYNVRDLSKDWKLGIINVPREVLAEARITTDQSYKTLRKSSVVDQWLKAEVTDASAYLKQVMEQVLPTTDPLTRRVLNTFARRAIKSVA